MDEQQLQQQIVQLVQAAMQGDQQATQQIQQIMQAAQQGDQQAAQLAQMIQQVAQQIQQQQVQAAKFGAKLNYIKQLRGVCPDGYEMQYFKEGGSMGARYCKKCVAKQKKMEEGGKAPSNPIDAFKCGRKMKKKACGGSVEINKGGTTKGGVTLKSETSSKNKYGDTVTTRKWSDGSISKKYTPEEGESVYEGRNGERSVAQQDSLWRADWKTKIAPPRKKK